MQIMLVASGGRLTSPKLPIYRDVCTAFIPEEIVHKWRIYAVSLKLPLKGDAPTRVWGRGRLGRTLLVPSTVSHVPNG